MRKFFNKKVNNMDEFKEWLEFMYSESKEKVEYTLKTDPKHSYLKRFEGEYIMIEKVLNNFNKINKDE